MQNVALLLGAIASVISALGGTMIGVLALRRGSRRERQEAAEGTAERLMRPSTVDQAAIETALTEYFHQHEHPREATPDDRATDATDPR